MKRKLSALAGRYLDELQRHLGQSPRASLEPARVLGRHAVAMGLETLDVAKMHERALAMLEASASRDGILKRATIFFTETITPIEETHLNALKTNARLSRLNRVLSRRRVDLTASNRSLKQRIVERKTMEATLKKSEAHYKKLLRESLALQKHLQHLTHGILATQEDKRAMISHELQDEIAQTLLGLNVRLLALKKGAGLNANILQKEVASAQRLVDMSVKIIERFAREIVKHHEP